MTACTQFLKQNLVPDNIHFFYTTADFFDNKDLLSYCEEKILIDPKSFFDSLSFKNCDRNMLKRIVSIDLHCYELMVFNACMDWAKQKCEAANIDGNSENCKEQLGDCFHLIRFTAMTNEEFCTVLQNHKSLFDIDTLTDIYTHITLKQPLQVENRNQFNTTRRKTTLTCDRQSMAGKAAYHKFHEKKAMTFSTNQ